MSHRRCIPEKLCCSLAVWLYFLVMNCPLVAIMGDPTKSSNSLPPRSDLAYALSIGGESGNRFQLVEECPNGTEVNGVSNYLQQNVEFLHSTSSQQKPELHSNFQLLDIQDPLAQVLSLDPNSGHLTVSGRVDREALCPELAVRKPTVHTASNVPLFGAEFGPLYGPNINNCIKKLRVLSTTRLSRQKQPDIKSLPIEILIEDVNDNSPEWRDLPVWSSFGSDFSGPERMSVIEVQLPETSKDLATGHLAQSTRISLPLAHDPDDGLNSQLNYRIEPIQLSGEVNSNSKLSVQTTASLPFLLEKHANGQLDLVATANLDYEKQSLHQFYLLASDSGSPQLTGTALVKVHLVDVNDEVPVFDRSIFYPASGAVSEKTTPGTLLLNLSATDSDASIINSRLRYSMVPNTMAFKYFTVHPDGRVTLRHWLDYESMESSSTVPLPSIPSTGLDHSFHVDSKKRFVFQVLAVDSAPQPYEKTGTALVVIPVIDENDEAPIITVRYLGGPEQTNHKEIGVIEENNPVPTRIAYVQVNDPDFEGRDQLVCHLSDNVNFSLTPISSLQSPDIGFAIETQEELKNDYVLSLITKVDREQTPILFVRIKCLDQAGNANEQTIRIRVLDVNDENPKFSQAVYRFVVPENTSPDLLAQENRKHGNQTFPSHGYRIGQVLAQDADYGTNAKLIYKLEPSTLQIVQAKIMDKGLDPVEHQSQGVFVFHPLGVVRPNLEDLFSIDPETGVISALKSFDAENVDLFRFSVSAEDQPDGVGAVPRKGNATIEVKVTDVNDWSPMFYLVPSSDLRENIVNSNTEDQLEFVTSYVFHVKENRPAFWLVGRVAAIDPDVSLQTHYLQSKGRSLGSPPSPLSLRISPESDPDVRKTFTLHASSGHLRTVIPLDREAKAVHIFHILASDTNRDSVLSRTGTATVTVFVEDENDNSPVFVRPIAVTRDFSQSRTINPGLDNGHSVDVTVTTSTPDNAARKTDVQTGGLQLFDSVAKTNQVLRSTGTGINRDGPVPFVVVHKHTWTQQNDNTGGQQFPHSRSLLQLEATDADAGENGTVTYHIGAGNRDNLFQLDNTTGTLMLSPKAWASPGGVQETVNSATPPEGLEKGHSIYLLRFEACDRGVPKRCALPIWVRIMLDMNGMPQVNTKDSLGIHVSPYSDFHSSIENSYDEQIRLGSVSLDEKYLAHAGKHEDPRLIRSQTSIGKSEWPGRNGMDKSSDKRDFSASRFNPRESPFGPSFFRWPGNQDRTSFGIDQPTTSGLVMNEAVIVCLVVIFVVLLCATAVLIYLVRRRVIYFGSSSREKTKGDPATSKRPNDYTDQPVLEPLEMAENGSVYQMVQSGLTILPEGVKQSVTTTTETSRLTNQCDLSAEHFINQPLIRRNSDPHLALGNGIPCEPNMAESIYMGNGPFRQPGHKGADYQSLLLKNTSSFGLTSNANVIGRSITPFCETGTKNPNLIRSSVYNRAFVSPRWRSMTYHNAVSPLYRFHSPLKLPVIHDYPRTGQYPMIRDMTALTSSLYSTNTAKLPAHLRGNSTPIYSRERETSKWQTPSPTMDTSHTYHELSTLTATLRKHNYSSPQNTVCRRDEQHSTYKAFLQDSDPITCKKTQEKVVISKDTENVNSDLQATNRSPYRKRQSERQVFQTPILGQAITGEFPAIEDSVLRVIENPQERSAPILLSGFETFRRTDATMKTSSSSLPLILDTGEEFGTSPSPDQEQTNNQDWLPQPTQRAPVTGKYVYHAYREASFV